MSGLNGHAVKLFRSMFYQFVHRFAAGLRANLAVGPLRASIGGGGASMTFRLTNVSGRPVQIFGRLEIKLPGTTSAASVTLAITRLDGLAFMSPKEVANLTAGPRPEELVWLAPGESLSNGPIALLDGRGIREPGRYGIAVSAASACGRTW